MSSYPGLLPLSGDLTVTIIAKLQPLTSDKPTGWTRQVCILVLELLTLTPWPIS